MSTAGGLGSSGAASASPPLQPRSLSPGAAASSIAARRPGSLPATSGAGTAGPATPRSSLQLSVGAASTPFAPSTAAAAAAHGVRPGVGSTLSIAESARKLAVSAAGRTGVLLGSPHLASAPPRAGIATSPEGTPASTTARLHLRSMIADKERELSALEQNRLERAEARLSEAEQRLHARDSECAALKSNLEQVTADFRYNLKVREREGGGEGRSSSSLHCTCARTPPFSLLHSLSPSCPTATFLIAWPARQVLAERDSTISRLEVSVGGVREAEAGRRAAEEDARRAKAAQARLRGKRGMCCWPT